jgi:leader peptidase (prepilin peptidase)/N-methyltransferase
LIGLILIIVFFADLIYGIIPDLAVAAMSIISLVYRYILVTHGAMQKEDFWWAIAAALVAGGIFWGLHIVTKGKGMGFGDVKLAAVMGLILGHPRTWIALFLAFVIGAIVASGMLIMGKKKFKQTVPFGPFLIIGLCLALVWGDRLWSWYFGMLK